MKAMLLKVSPELLAGLFKDGQRHFAVEQGLPADAVISQVQWSPWDKLIVLRVCSATYPEVSVLPQITPPIFRRLECPSRT